MDRKQADKIARILEELIDPLIDFKDSCDEYSIGWTVDDDQLEGLTDTVRRLLPVLMEALGATSAA